MDRYQVALIVDDDPVTRLIIREAINQQMQEVIEAENGLEAIDSFDERQPDLVILDVSMPKMDGFETCQRIRAHPQGSSVPVIIITGSDDIQSIGKAYEAGATDFFSKPIHRKILSERVRYILRADETSRKLHQSREFLSKAQAVAALGSFLYKPGSSFMNVSEEFRNRFGSTEKTSAFPWDVFWQKIHPDDQKKLFPLFQEANCTGRRFREDIRITDDNGGNSFAMLHVDPQQSSDGDAPALFGIVQDITERKLSELFEADQSHVMKLIIQKAPIEKIFLAAANLLDRQRPQASCAICRVENGRIHNVISARLPEQFCEIMSEIPLSIHDGTCAAAAYLGQPATAGNIESSRFWSNKREEALAHGLKSSSSVPVFSGTGEVLGTVVIMRQDAYYTTTGDIEVMERVADLVALASEQENLSRQLIYQARHDPLTGLLNRGALNQYMTRVLKQIIRKSSFGAYMLIDLDRFKRINDSLGHHHGDSLLLAIAERLGHCVRESDIVSRVGGDEFVIFLSEIKNKEDAASLASRILESLKSPFTIEGRELAVDASIGITVFPQDATDSAALHKNADIAMYVAKNQGGGRFQFFDNRMHEEVIHRLEIENDLRKGFEQNEFELHYQPQVNLDSDELMVMEALIRWNHPEKGRIPPNHFIPVAEESRLIIPIGKWVLNEACRQNKAWQEEGFSPVRVAVNVSAVQFTETDFVQTVQDALEKTGLDPTWLEIEITESVVMKDMEKAGENLRKLKTLGVTTTLDDFGTGYSSITYLNNMPLDGIKVDQCFIREMTIHPGEEECRNTNFIKSFVSMARNLSIQIVAEGVETLEQHHHLKKLGYKIGQGFLFSVPLPANEVIGFLSRQSDKKSRFIMVPDSSSVKNQGKTHTR